MEFIATFCVCTLSGLFTGVLGIGGGLIIVPMFLTVLPFFGIEYYSIHQIIGISATCVFFNSTMTVFYRRKEEFLPKSFIKKVAIAIILGTLCGAILSSFAPQKLILSIYICVSIISLANLLKPENAQSENPMEPEKMDILPLTYLAFAGIGAISASIGIGGAILFANAMKYFFKKEPKELLPTISLLVAINALFAFVGKSIAGDVIVKIIPIAIIASILGAKTGVMISRKLSSKTITNLMVATLLVAMIRVIVEIVRL